MNDLKMKTTFLTIFVFALIAVQGSGQANKITVKGCIDAAMKNKANIQAVKTEVYISALQTKTARAGYLPHISVAYDYRYNLIIPTSIVPVGMFYPVPTDAIQAIKFGTNWQQNAGLTLFQPLVDLSVRSRVAESRINEKIRNTDLAGAEQDLKLEVIKSFLSVYLKNQQMFSTRLDTVRTRKTLELIQAKSEGGRILRTELNKAVVNHNKSLSAFHSATSELVKEKIYLSFLTGFPLRSMLKSEFDFSVLDSDSVFTMTENPVFDSLPEIQQLKLKAELTLKQEESEKRSMVPVIGVDGFIGTNQYTNTFDPTNSSNWYGNSYVGLSIKMPVISGRNVHNKVSQLKLQQQGINYSLEEEQNKVTNNILKLGEDIRRLEKEKFLSAANVKLLEENISLYQERFDKGQINSYDLLTEEIDLQKEKAELNRENAELIQKQVELMKNAGTLSSFIDKLK
jgi:outer membrane protein